MALTPEQQAQIDFQMVLETERFKLQKDFDMVRIRAEMIRLAKETLIQNKLSAPVELREVTAQEITAYAQTLADYVNP